MIIVLFWKEGHRPPTIPTIAKLLLKEALPTSRQGICYFLEKYRETNSIARRDGVGRKSKVTTPIKMLIQEKMQDDQTTVKELKMILSKNEISLGSTTNAKCRHDLGWTYRGSAFCQMIWD